MFPISAIRRTVVCALVLAFGPSAGAALYISEFMAQNDSSRRPDGSPMRDEEGTYADWIEVWNAGSEAVDLDGWSLTDRPDDLRRWSFPPFVLGAGQRVIVWASDKDRTDPNRPLHTNFKLSSGGDYLALVRRDGATVEHEWAPFYPPQLRNRSYGLDADGSTPAYFSTPTPGEPNGPGDAGVPPIVLDVPESPPFLPPGPIVLPITARVLPVADPVVSVTLEWRKMFDDDVTVPMRDDGTNGDAAAADGIWTGTISGVTLAPGEMLRWRVIATDAGGRAGKAPPANVPNDSANYYGTIADDPSLAAATIPVMHWFMAPGVNPNTNSGGRVAIAWLGEFYDNVHANLHGQSTASFPKKSYNLDFPTDRQVRWNPDQPRVADLKLLSNYADKTKSRNTLSYAMYADAGVAGHFAFPVRVQRNGEFYAIADLVEDADEHYLTRAGLNPDGALYKLYAPFNSGLPSGESGYEKKTRKGEPATDLNELAAGLKQSGDNRLRFGYDNIDIPATVNYLAALNMTHNNDTGHKNYYLYRDTGRTGEWRLLPWDVDLSFGHNWTGTFNYFDDQLYTTNPATPASAPGSGNIMFRFGYNGSSAIAEMYLRRLRTLRDRFLAESGTDDWHHRKFGEMLDLLDPQGAGTSVAELDYDRWSPAAWKLSGQPQNNSPFRNNTMREEIARVLDTYVTGRRRYLYRTMTSMPAAQPARPALQFGTVDFNPPAPDGREGEYFSIVNTENLAIDISGWTISGGVDFVFPGGTVIPSATRATPSDPERNRLYVAKSAAGFRGRAASPKGNEKRLVVSGYAGQLSARGESLELRTDAGDPIATTEWPASPTPAQQFLRIAELHCAPLPPTQAERAGWPEVVAADFEFLELVNTGTTTIDLSGAAFTEGIRYTFPAGTSLAAGARLVVCSSTRAFALRYPGVAALGNWTGRLDNSGERVQLADPTGETVLDFRYEASWFPGNAGQGHSYTIVDEAGTAWNDWGQVASWALSGDPGGTPGQPAAGTPSGTTYASWQAAHFSGADLANPEISGPAADPDGDGLTNLAEYAFALHPRLPSAGAEVAPVLLDGEGARYPGIRIRRIAGAEDLTWSVESSGDLTGWNPAAFSVHDSAAGDDGTETVTLRLESPLAGSLSLRVRVATGSP